MSCGKPLGGLWEKYCERVSMGEKPAKVLDDLGIKNYCCRSLFLTHRDLLHKTGKYRV